VADQPLYPKLVWSYVETELGEDARILAESIAERDLGAYLRQRRAVSDRAHEPAEFL
jgi:hypothetical protein